MEKYSFTTIVMMVAVAALLIGFVVPVFAQSSYDDRMEKINYEFMKMDVFSGPWTETMIATINASEYSLGLQK
jgi:hypothetical protein